MARRRRQSPGEAAQTRPARVAGFAAIDALTALAILSMTLLFSIQALRAATRAGAMAVETRAARSALDSLVDQPLRALGRTSGRYADFDWAVSVEPAPAAGEPSPPRLCRRAVILTARRSGRIYRAATLNPCPREGAAA